MFVCHKYRLSPTRAQHRALERILEDQRQLYNCALEHRIERYRKTGRTPSYIDQTGELTVCRKQVPGLVDTAVTLQRGTLKRLEVHYQSFFRKLKAGEKTSPPQFRPPGSVRSFDFSEWDGFRWDGKRLRFKGLPGGLKVCLHRPLPNGKLVGCTIKQDVKGWTVSIRLSLDECAPRPIVSSVGVDLGLMSLAALSDGTIIDNPRIERRSSKRVRRLQRQLARCQKDSRRRQKIGNNLKRARTKVVNSRRTYLHQVSAPLVRKYDLIAIEALNVKGLSKGFGARSVRDAGWGILIKFLRYKATAAGARVAEVNPRGTSKECPACGAVASKTLKRRTHRCPCGCVLDRDVAAAQIILKRAVAGPWLANVAHLGASVEPETSAVENTVDMPPQAVFSHKLLHIRPVDRAESS